MTDTNRGFLFTRRSLFTRSNLIFLLKIFHHHVTADSIKEALKQVKYPGFSRDIVSFGLVHSAAFADGTAKVSLALTTSDLKLPALLKAEVKKGLLAQPGVKAVIIELAVAAAKAAPQPGAGSVGGGTTPAGIKHSIAIASGKGGVGKST